MTLEFVGVDNVLNFAGVLVHIAAHEQFQKLLELVDCKTLLVLEVSQRSRRLVIFHDEMDLEPGLQCHAQNEIVYRHKRFLRLIVV